MHHPGTHTTHEAAQQGAYARAYLWTWRFS